MQHGWTAKPCNATGQDVRSVTVLERAAGALSEAGVENTGVKTDPTLGRKYIAFKDPDRVAWELYMA